MWRGGRWGPAAGRERTWEQGGKRGPRVENVGRPGEEGKWARPERK
jgi:hypothetical protein